MIDAHLHLWTLEPKHYPWQQTLAHIPIPTQPATVEELLPLLDAAGVDYAVAVQPSVYGWDNSYVCDCIERHSDRLIGVCLVNPRAANAAERLRYWCAERGCRGLRIQLHRADRRRLAAGAAHGAAVGRDHPSACATVPAG